MAKKEREIRFLLIFILAVFHTAIHKFVEHVVEVFVPKLKKRAVAYAVIAVITTAILYVGYKDSLYRETQ